MQQYIQDFRTLDIKTRKSITSGFLGNFKSTFRGNGLTFSEFKTREEGEDVTRIDWLVSAREGKMLVKKMEEDREIQVLFFIDISPTMLFGFERTKKHILVDIFFLLSLSSQEDGNKFGAIIYGGESVEFFPFTKKKEAIFELYKKIEAYQNGNPRTHFEHAFHLFQNLRLKRNLVFLMTDTFDIQDSYLKILAFGNELIFMHIFHSFENTLDVEINTITSIQNGKNQITIDTQNDSKKSTFTSLRKEKIHLFSKKIVSYGGDYISFDEKSNVFKTFFTFMQNRTK